MPRSANSFQDPAGVRPTYPWVLNHSDEGDWGVDRNIEHGAPTGNVGLIRQQGDSSPMLLSISGTILRRAQLVEFLAWVKLCDTQTIYFHDFAGDSYEVQITKLTRTRHRTLKNPQDFANAPYHYWTYTMEMEVLRFIDGPDFEADITP